MRLCQSKETKIKMRVVSISLVAAIIFLQTNCIILAKTDSEGVNSDSGSDYLSSDIFPPTLLNILSADVLSKADPLALLLEKTGKLSQLVIHAMSNYIMNYLMDPEIFPRRYVPYVKLLSALLRCQINLEDVQRNISQIQRSGRSPQLPDVSNVDPALSALFSREIFTDTDPPSQLINKLVEIPNNKISDLAHTMENFFNDHDSSWKNSTYAKYLWKYLDRNKYNIIRLKSAIFRIHQQMPKLDSTTFQDQVSNNV